MPAKAAVCTLRHQQAGAKGEPRGTPGGCKGLYGERQRRLHARLTAPRPQASRVTLPLRRRYVPGSSTT